jgi:hypothetical protein
VSATSCAGRATPNFITLSAPRAIAPMARTGKIAQAMPASRSAAGSRESEKRSDRVASSRELKNSWRTRRMAFEIP